MNGTSPTNDLSFTVSSVANTRIVGQANSTYSNLPSSTIVGLGTGATFNVTRNTFGDISSITVANGGVGYALTDNLKISGSLVGGVTPADDLYLTPKVLGTDKLPSTLYITKIDNDNYKVSGLSTSNELNITSYVESSLIVRKGPDSSPYLSVASTESSIIMQVEGGNGQELVIILLEQQLLSLEVILIYLKTKYISLLHHMDQLVMRD